jgi:uncharacterized delta-60 repeat protein
VTHVVGTGSCVARAVAIQPDGRIVVAGFSSDDLIVFRLDQQGALDPSFSGVPVASFTGIRLGIAIQADGRIVVAGESDGGTYSEVAVARYLSEGSLDASFDGDGLVTTSIGAGDDAGLAVAIQTDGKIVVAGRAIVGSTADFALVRYRPNGELDDSFGTFGRVMTDIDAGGWDDASGLAIQPDGRIVVAGGSQSDVALARYDTNGALDPTFDGDGKVTTATGIASGIALQADGKVVVTGESLGSAANFAILRYNTDGSLDVGYGSGGRVEIDFDGWDDYAHGIALDGMGRAVIAGDGNGRFGVVRLLGDADLASAPRLDGMPSGSRIVSVAPNPGGGRQSFVVEVARGDPSLSLAIFSVTGQVVFRRDLRGLAPGTHRIAWEERTRHGGGRPPGSTSPGSRVARRIRRARPTLSGSRGSVSRINFMSTRPRAEDHLTDGLSEGQTWRRGRHGSSADGHVPDHAPWAVPRGEVSPRSTAGESEPIGRRSETDRADRFGCDLRVDMASSGMRRRCRERQTDGERSEKEK